MAAGAQPGRACVGVGVGDERAPGRIETSGGGVVGVDGGAADGGGRVGGYQVVLGEVAVEAGQRREPPRRARGGTELWAPEWREPCRLDEVTHLLAEGRSEWNARPARSGLDFARAVASLGVRFHARARTGTIRAQLIDTRGRLARSAHRLVLPLPRDWPWGSEFDELFGHAMHDPLLTEAS